MTVPNDADFLAMCAVVWSILPWCVVALNILEVAYRRGTKQLSFLLFVCAITGINEFVVKKLVKEPRPGAKGLLTDDLGVHVGSCSIKCGMPSSHCTMSVGFLLLMLFDGVYRVIPSQASLTRGGESSFEMGLTRSRIKKWFTTTPLSPSNTMSHKEFLWFFLFWSAVLLPVPISRIKLYDHSVDQVVIGSLLGGVYALSWFVITMFFVRRNVAHTGMNFGPYQLFVHDYHPPEFRVRIRQGATCSRGVEIVAASDADLRGETTPSRESTMEMTASGISTSQQHVDGP